MSKPRVMVQGEMTVRWSVELPVEHARSSIACEDPAVEAAMQAVTNASAVYVWGEDQRPARVFAEVDEQDVTIESDDRD